MQHSTFKALKRAFMNDVDAEALKKNAHREPPFIQFQIDTVLNGKPHVKRFLEIRFPQTKHISKPLLDETVVTYLLFVANIVKYDKLNRTFLRPAAWAGEICWIRMLKMLIYCVVTLLYDVRWKSHYFFLLDSTVQDLMLGKTNSLRILFRNIGMNRFTPQSFPVENDCELLHFHSANEFGPYYWQLLHWMAEAFELRHGHEDVENAKSMWRDFVTSTMYRTLRCYICMRHYRNVSQRFRDKLLKGDDYGEIWFEIHNVVRSATGKPPYLSADFERDRQSMRSVLQEK